MPACFSSYIAVENKDEPAQAHLFVCQAAYGAKERKNCPYARNFCNKDRHHFQAARDVKAALGDLGEALLIRFPFISLCFNELDKHQPFIYDLFINRSHCVNACQKG